ncbi:hypothetical protein ANN_07755 [Periplaneta americana]|uniref:Uncharacterized protein n=1 Tax=Periplaneta americana TaxID=6978 RepID=A0ABQ8T130_PERAM|nr:hypothetical protein ANN_07755 [Periplaneta americana]
MAGLCEGGNEPPGFLKAKSDPYHIYQAADDRNVNRMSAGNLEENYIVQVRPVNVVEILPFTVDLLVGEQYSPHIPTTVTSQLKAEVRGLITVDISHHRRYESHIERSCDFRTTVSQKQQQNHKSSNHTSPLRLVSDRRKKLTYGDDQGSSRARRQMKRNMDSNLAYSMNVSCQPSMPTYL